MQLEPAIEIDRLPSDFEHWDELLNLIRRSFASMDGVIDPPSSALRLTTDLLRRKAEAETCFVATQGGRIVGCVFVSDRQDHAYIGKLAVDPGLQGLGIGRALVEAAAKLALHNGTRALELETRVELTKNHAAFHHLGFRETARTAHPGYDRPTSITMRKVLG